MADETLWERATAGELWGSTAARTLESQFRAARGGREGSGSDAEIAAWLRQQGLVTAWQAEVLETGAGGPFRLGDYWLEARLSHPDWPDVFAARHLPTKFPVHLFFLGGDSAADLQRWESLTRRLAAARRLTSASWLRYFDGVELPDYRFVVGERVELASVAQKLGRRGRTPWPAAVASVVRVALALQELRATDLEGLALNSHNVYLQPGGAIRLVPPVLVPDPRGLPRGSVVSKAKNSGAEEDPGDLPADYQLQGDARTTRTDQEIYALGVLLYRLIRGETLRAAAQLPDGSWSPELAGEKLAKYELPPGLVQLLKSFATPQWRSPWAQTAAFAQALVALGGESARAEPGPAVRSAEETAYLESIRRWQPGAAERAAPSGPIVIAAPVEQADADGRAERFRRPVHLPPAARGELPPALDHRTARPRGVRPPNSQTLAGGLGAVLAVSFLVCAAAVYFGYRRFAAGQPVAATPSPSGPVAPGPAETRAVPAEPVPPPAVTPNATPGGWAGGWSETLLPDDGQRLWQSPTAGPPLDLVGLPAGPTLVVACRPAEIARRGESELLVRALGAATQARLAAITDQFGLPAADIEELLIGLYPDDHDQLRACYLARLPEPQLAETFAGRWEVQGFQTSGQPHLFRKGDWAYAMLPAAKPAGESQDPAATAEAAGDTEDRVAILLAGPADLVAAAQELPAQPLVGPLERLLPRTQRARLLTVLATRAELVGESLDPLLPEPFSRLRSGLDPFLPDAVRAVAFSAHWDDAVFVELVCEATVDRKTGELVSEFNQRFRTARDTAAQAAAASAANPYWDRVRLRFDNMLADLGRQTRVGAEQGQVLANVWLPLPAGHNLLAATELILATHGGGATGGGATAGGATGVAAPPQIPSDLSQLLAARFTLRDANPPDLNIIVDNLQTMVRDRFPTLPFAVEIRLSNAELKEAGITRNQRPGPLELVDQSLAQILTAIVFGANPDKNAKSPNDPLCKLIWVAIPPTAAEPGVIWITTRAGAEQQGWPLPPPFVK